MRSGLTETFWHSSLIQKMYITSRDEAKKESHRKVLVCLYMMEWFMRVLLAGKRSRGRFDTDR